MRKSVFVFAGSVIAVAVLLLLPLDYLQILRLPPRDLLAVAFLITLGVVSDAFPITYSVGNRAVASSISFVPIFTAILLFPTPAAIVVSIGIFAFSTLVIMKYPIWAAGFNIAQVAIATRFAAYIYDHSQTIPIFSFTIVRLFAMAATLFITNMIIISLYIYLRHGLGIKATVRKVAGPGGSNIYYDLLVSPLALLASSVYPSLGIIGIAILILPLFIIRHSYASLLEVQQANRALLQVLIKAIETRDPYTSGHSMRVSILAKAIGQDYGISGKRLEEVETAALLHDIGKVDGVYAQLIMKPHSLTQQEISIIRTHATKGAEFVAGLKTYSPEVVASIRHHHEKYDGSGYPDGLAKEEIPLPARIIQISDSVDAMLSDRPYRKALSLEAVYAELDRCAGTQFDPELISAITRSGTIGRVLEQLRSHGGNPDNQSRRPASPTKSG